MVDLLNRGNERNYINSNYSTYNCGGFALETYSWYQPLSGYSSTIEILNNEGLSFIDSNRIDAYPEFYDYMTQFMVEDLIIPRMMKDFKDRHIRRVKGREQVDFANENLISLRVGIEFSLDEDETAWWADDFDFHYRLYNPQFNLWYEKCGKNHPRIAPNNWDENFLYNSNIYYFAVDAKNSNLIFENNKEPVIIEADDSNENLIFL